MVLKKSLITDDERELPRHQGKIWTQYFAITNYCFFPTGGKKNSSFCSWLASSLKLAAECPLFILSLIMPCIVLAISSPGSAQNLCCGTVIAVWLC